MVRIFYYHQVNYGLAPCQQIKMEELPGSKYTLETIQAIFGIIAELWPYRLAVRTPGSHPGNPGSIPGRVTTEKLSKYRQL